MTLGLSSLLGLNSTASWRDGYVEASFRGVKFKIKQATERGGRRIVQHDFPETDESINEDLGKKNNDYSLSAYIIGDEYYNQREDLKEALEKEGPGVLIHPYRGEVIVVCPSYTITETTEEGRMCRLDIQFHLDKVEALTVLGPGPFDKLNDAIATFQAEALSLMGTIFNIANSPNAVLDDLQSIIQVGLTIVDSTKSIMDVDDVFKRNLASLQDNLEDLLASPSILLSETQELITFGTDTTDPDNDDYVNDSEGAELFANMKNLTDFQDTSYSEFPGITNVDGEPAKEMAKFISRTALAARAGLINTMTIENSTQADEISKELDTVIQTIENDSLISDDFYAAARDLRVAVREVINERKLDLGVLVDIELPEFTPGIVLSHDLYSDSTRDEEIAELNDTIHPGFIPSGNILVKDE